jgi:signal transduction histidine kinase
MGRDYIEQWRRADGQLGLLERRIRGDREQRARAARLRSAFVARGAELAQVAQNTNFGRNAAAYAFFNEARRSPHLAVLTRESGAIFAAERTQLSARAGQARATAANAVQETNKLAIFGVLLAFGAIILAWLNVRAIRDRAAAAAEAEVQRARSVEMEAAVAAATAGLQAEARERAAAEDKLRQVQKMEAVGQLTGGIAHDFNNMLAVVLGGLELAKRNLPPGADEALRHIDNAGEGANRAAALTRQLLGFARSEALAPEAIEPTELIEGMSVLLDRTLGEGIVIETRSEGTEWCVWADRVQLENALLNLAVNARDAMDGRGTLIIASGHVALDGDDAGECAPGDYVRISVTDSGTGMTRRGDGPGVRTVLHDQTGRQGNRPRPQPDFRLCPAVRGRGADRIDRGRRYHGDHAPALPCDRNAHSSGRRTGGTTAWAPPRTRHPGGRGRPARPHRHARGA